jgi:hypothetical protein
MTKLNKILFYKSMWVFWKDQKGHDRKKEIGIKFHILDQLIPCLLLFEFTFKKAMHILPKNQNFN